MSRIGRIEPIITPTSIAMSNSSTPKLDVEFARSQFPALKSGFVFADNAGGSQAAVEVVNRITDYLLNTNVQLGADYSVSVQSTQRVADGPVEGAKLFNAASPDEFVFGSSSTLNLENLARGLESGINSSDEFIITGEHEGRHDDVRTLNQGSI